MASIISTYSQTPPREVRIDEVNGNLTYLGLARVGADTSAAIWQIRRIQKDGGSQTAIEYADGDDLYNNIWDNRASLSYS